MGQVANTVAAATPSLTSSANPPAASNVVRSDAGRPLGYGQVVNGVRTFSDGSGTGGIPRTMSDDQIKSLGANINTISDANFVNPGAGTLGVTPELGSLNRTLPQANPLSSAISAELDRQNAERGARSDVGSIFNEDQRSALGIAARNARINLSGMHGARTSRYGGGMSPYQGAIQGLIDQANAPVVGANGAATRATELTRTGMTEQGSLDRAKLTTDAENNRSNAQLSRGLDRYETDPTTGAVTLIRNGVAQPVTDQSGKAFSLSQQPTKVAPEIAKVANDIYNGLPDKDAQGKPISDEDRWNTALARANGQSGAPASVGTAPPPEAIDMLRKNPSLKAKFDAQFGKGLSDRYLKNG